jgi:hypothetical protein
VGKWRQRFVEYRLQGIYDELRPGRPRSISDEQVSVLLRRTLKQKLPPGATHWSVRLAAEANGLSKSTVHRVFQLFALQPHRTKSFKLSTDPNWARDTRALPSVYDRGVLSKSRCLGQRSAFARCDFPDTSFSRARIARQSTYCLRHLPTEPRLSSTLSLPTRHRLSEPNR